MMVMNDSLRKQVIRLIKKHNPDISLSKREQILCFVDNPKAWYVIVSITIFVFFIPSLIHVPILSCIPIEISSVKTLINSRTTNVVTMISVTFAIIGFLIANLAIKESFTYNLLFKKSGFFPVAFMALSLIACFIALSTVGDWLSFDYQSNVLLAGTYLIFIVIFLIGYLFTKLIRFTNQKYILNLVRRELLSESKRKLLRVGERVASYNEISRLGLQQYSMSFLRNMTQGEFMLPSGHNMISDIKINELRKRIAAIKNRIFVNKLFLNREIVNNEDGFFFVDVNDYPALKEDIRKLNKCIITSPKSKDTDTEAKEYVLQKLEENIKSNDDKLVESYLDMLSEVYRLQQQFKI
jgi:hypothetical protein